MPEKRTVSAKEVAADINSGMSDDALCAKYRLSANVLEKLKVRLREKGFITEITSDLRLAVTPSMAITDKRALARAIADTIKGGASDRRIISRFHITPDKLPNVYATLLRSGFLTQEDLDQRSEDTEGDPTSSGFPLPASPLPETIATTPVPAAEETLPAADIEASPQTSETTPESQESSPTSESVLQAAAEPTDEEMRPAADAPQELAITWTCPACGVIQNQKPKFCPSCGAPATMPDAMTPSVENSTAPDSVPDQGSAANGGVGAPVVDQDHQEPVDNSRPTEVEPLTERRRRFAPLRYIKNAFAIFKNWISLHRRKS